MYLIKIFRNLSNSKNDSIQSGFSLIEIIMVLVLLGVVGAIGTSGLTTFIKNFSISRQVSDTSSTAQMAMLRMAKEFVTISEVNITETTDKKIRFTAKRSATNEKYFMIEFSDPNLNLFEYNNSTTTTPLSVDPDLLLLANNVSSFSLQYFNWVTATNTLSAPATTWSSSTRLIRISLVMDGVSDPFTISIAPRNI